MNNPIFDSLLNSKDKFQRYDAVNEVLVISTSEHELKISTGYIKLDAVQYNPNLVNAHHGVPLHRETIAFIDYGTFLASNTPEVFGITREDILELLEYYRSLG